ncbi:hypothetical protein PV10_00784 [Exophiala mesophila]|uniref:amidase n=1 Tax=Exophiala mesophila TaxID=212818 RepID=A0A0D1ZSV8_EXOME|nr:uncharacterized protein PV10_00784 [Exophiala mesophila]KIV96974.1 hypothetical protein PV10_00784 [Exophiala mesophila]
MSTSTTTTAASAPEPWQAIAQRKQAQRASLIPEAWRIPEAKIREYTASPTANVLHVPSDCGILSSLDRQITESYDAIDLLALLAKGPDAGGFTSVEVVTAFCKRAAIAQQVTNCVTEILFESAIARAEELDRQRAANPSAALPPLWGLPISLKDCFKVPGVDASIAMIHFAEKPSTEYSALPKLLLSLGAVFHCKTNVPQTMMTADSDSNVFGRTMNPNNRALTAGGSSGGEGALVAMRGSVLGVGSDIAGSIRIPSHCNGTYGFKPSANIVPYAGQANPAADGLAGILPVAGPLATSFRSCRYFMQLVMSSQPWKYDMDCLHIPWLGLKPPAGRNLRIGVINDDGLFTPTPPQKRTFEEAKAKLKAAGVELVDIQLPNLMEDIAVAWACFGMEASRTALGYIAAAGEPKIKSVENIGLTGGTGMTIEELFAWNVARSKVEAKHRDLWVSSNVDAYINLLVPHTAPRIDTWTTVVQALWNLIDYPSCIIPTGKVSDKDVVDPNGAKFGDADRALYEQYTGPEDFKGAPTSIQVIGLRQEDENLSIVAEMIDKILNP